MRPLRLKDRSVLELRRNYNTLKDQFAFLKSLQNGLELDFVLGEEFSAEGFEGI